MGMLLVTGEAASGAEPPEAQRLPATPSAGVVAGELVAALDRGDLAAFDRLAGRPVPPSVAVRLETRMNLFASFLVLGSRTEKHF